MEDSLDKLASKMNNRSMAQRSQKQEIYTTSKKAWSHFALLLILSLKAHLSTASDTMYRGQPLAWKQTLTSKSGFFELGFFTPGKSHKHYVGIWYKTIAELTVVWVANRDCPVSDPSSKALEISEDGNLLITEKGIPFCKCTNSGMPNYTVAVLLDNGNFILRDKLDNVLWQSFEEQTNTLLPGAKIGYNRLTNKSNILRSWTSSENPGSGHFSAELEESGLVLYYISNSPWLKLLISNVSFINIWNDRYWLSTHYTYVFNESEGYFTYSSDYPISARFVLDVTGDLNLYIWSSYSQIWNLVWTEASRHCEIHGFCGNYGICTQLKVPPCDCPKGFEPRWPGNWSIGDYSGGCIRRTPLGCSNGGIDKFLTVPNMHLGNLFGVATKINGTVQDIEACKLACLRDCDCIAYSCYDECFLYKKQLMNLQISSATETGEDLYVRISASERIELVGSRTKMSKKVAWILGVSAMLILLLSIVLAIILWKPSADGALEESEFSLMLFKYRDLKKATMNFSQKLGEGGFGTVFKGTLPNSTTIAVKKIRSVEQGEKQFRAEVRTLGAIQHVNLLRLCGFCVEASKRFLVYDYMPKGSLESHLFQKVSKILDWNTRYHIAIGIARGLAYLHENCIDCIIHCDIKPENILLDAEYDPKVADFGLAKVIGRNFSRVLTTMRGTRGYLAPEWISGEAITPKVDVFSYGKLLFEIISGRRNINMLDEEICNYFPARVAMAINKGEDLLTLLDFKLEGNANMEELTRACKVACWCIQDDPRDRPTMGNVVKILEGLMQLGIPQIPLYFQRLSESPMEASVCREIETCSSSY
ncbi:G-type lectin S-receptor-like serine/threonine-protein kinase At2g19130 [Quercus suber]|uniref:G-type lectin S-receptor-like serine/threonine-protein kinase At2g19130 n=1 Tax=Quercus suber TaxID=58331 RepID=UPI0032DE4D17